MQENTCNRKLHYKIQQRKLLALTINAFLNTIFIDIPRIKAQQQQPGDCGTGSGSKIQIRRKRKWKNKNERNPNIIHRIYLYTDT